IQAGDFFGELGLVAGESTTHVMARGNLTCLVLSSTPIRPYAGRGAGATGAAEPPSAGLPPGTCAVDVTSYFHRKLGALARHRTQYPIVPSMLPRACCKACSAQSSSAALSAAALWNRGTPGGIVPSALTRAP